MSLDLIDERSLPYKNSLRDGGLSEVNVSMLDVSTMRDLLEKWVSDTEPDVDTERDDVDDRIIVPEAIVVADRLEAIFVLNAPTISK